MFTSDRSNGDSNIPLFSPRRQRRRMSPSLSPAFSAAESFATHSTTIPGPRSGDAIATCPKQYCPGKRRTETRNPKWRLRMAILSVTGRGEQNSLTGFESWQELFLKAAELARRNNKAGQNVRPCFLYENSQCIILRAMTRSTVLSTPGRKDSTGDIAAISPFMLTRGDAIRASFQRCRMRRVGES